jgi:hypothetical protein
MSGSHTSIPYARVLVARSQIENLRADMLVDAD